MRCARQLPVPRELEPGHLPATWQHLWYALLARPVVADHGRAPVAAFDADGTLWSGDAFGALGAVLVRRGLVDREACERVEVEYGRSQGEERREWLLESLALFRGLSAEVCTAWSARPVGFFPE